MAKSSMFLRSVENKNFKAKFQNRKHFLFSKNVLHSKRPLLLLGEHRPAAAILTVACHYDSRLPGRYVTMFINMVNNGRRRLNARSRVILTVDGCTVVAERRDDHDASLARNRPCVKCSKFHAVQNVAKGMPNVAERFD